VTVQDLYSGATINVASLKRVVVTKEEIQKYRLSRNDILIGNASVKRDGIGYANRFDGASEDVIFAKYAYRASNLRSVLPLYLHHILRADFCRQWIVANSQTGTLTNLNKTAAKAIPIAVPRTISEQHAIASALSDMDALVDGLDRLIAKWRDLKVAAMQQLLTGQTRLPGFLGKWEVKRLGDLGVFIKGSGVRKDESRSGDIPCIRYGEIYTHHHDCIRSFNSWISPEVARTATRLRQGDLLFAGSGETKADIGKCVAFVHECEAYAGGDIVILRPLGADPTFMGYYCNTSLINAQKASKGQGDAVVHISAAALGSISIKLPALAEQTAIAIVLSDMDAELAALNARRDKARALKQGMMQELLTGRTRLV
jgi:type I restriction enzyme S subunit